MGKDRILWIEYAKAIGIFLVIIGHGYAPREGFDFFTRNFIYSFHMPIFFFISGYLYRIKEDDFGFYLKNTAKSLLVPYILLNIIAAFIFAPILYLSAFSGIENILFDFATGGGHSFAGASWFLIALFWIRLLAYFAIKYNKTCIMVIITLSISYLTMKPCWFDLTSAAAAFPIFVLGYWSRQLNISDFIEKKKIICLCVSFPLLCGLTYLMQDVAIYSLSFGKYPALYYPYSIVGIVFFLSFCMCIGRKNNKIIFNISNGSILIMCLHAAVFTYCSIAVKILLPISENTFVYSMLVSSITLSLLYYPIIFIRNKFPILTGGR